MSPTLLLVVALQAAPQAELLDFTAEWCGPCQRMSSTVAKLEREGFPIRRIDVDQRKDLAGHYRISSIPAFVLVVNGREAGRLVGAQDERALRQLLAKIPAPAAEPASKNPFRWPFGRKKEESPEPPAFPETPSVLRGQDPAPTEAVPLVPTSATAPPAARDPMQTAVRIRVKDPRGTDLGSGTVIASREGKALVLTCYHIFREFGADAEVKVDLFPNGPQAEPQTFSGRLIKADEEADVALVGVDGCGLMAVSPVVPVDRFPKPGDHVFSVGCGNGEPPTKRQHNVTRINPYQGPGTTECSGVPEVGRSGGGLFDRDGRVVGVCFAAARQDKTGVYVGADEVHQLLTAANLAALIPAASGPFADLVPQDESAAPGEGVPQVDPPTGPVAFADEPAGDLGSGGVRPPAGGRREVGSSADHAAVLAALEGGAEVVCTIRPLNGDGPSEVVVINKASQRFIRYLRGELDQEPIETSLRIDGVREAAKPEAAGLRTRESLVALAAARLPMPGVALLSRVFHNHGRN